MHKGNHCAWSIHYHIVFPVKYRKALLDKEVVEIIRETAIGIQERYDIEIERMGMDNDHIHVLCGAHPKIAAGRIVQVFKSITAREIFRRKPAVKRDLWGGEFWSDGYYAGTVGDHGDRGSVERYNVSQGKPREELKQLKLL
ncbi:MAG TPA: IS200/IS605 family transposase [Nitrospirota bacterium]|nr:IS200/IS605 family transposase [Nitrospirota bacterium]